ncbi:MAG: presenilin family intramembrane aspartyl protease [Candidatus Bathyarchaeia archaeon]
MTNQEKENKEQDKFKFQIVYLVPILASIVFGLGCAYLLVPQSSESIPVTPIPDNTPAGPFGNALYFVVLVAISATVFYLLLKRRSKKIIKALIVVAMTTASLLLSLVYLSALSAFFPIINILVIPLSLVFTVLFDLAIFRFGNIARNVAVVLIGGALGIFFGKFIPLYSAVLILAFLAVYDVIAVYRGPVGKIAQSSGGLDDLQGLSFAFKDIQMGLGDLVFYSMLTGVMFFTFQPSILPVVIAVVGIIAGSVITFYMLERKGIFPGLPFPIMLGLTGGLITGLLILPIL